MLDEIFELVSVGSIFGERCIRLDPVTKISNLLAMRQEQHVVPQVLFETRPGIGTQHDLLELCNSLGGLGTKADVVQEFHCRRMDRSGFGIVDDLLEAML